MRSRRYLETIALVAGLLALLAVIWVSADRTFATLGLGPPITVPALAGMAVAAVLLTVVAVGVRRKREGADDGRDKLAADLLPTTPSETRLFILFAVVIGFGWEVLYRGFLLFYLQPLVGLVGAIAATVFAYGLGHGIRTPAQTIGSLAAALAFTGGYALTGSLWWLIVIHTCLPLVRKPPVKAALSDLAGPMT